MTTSEDLRVTLGHSMDGDGDHFTVRIGHEEIEAEDIPELIRRLVYEVIEVVMRNTSQGPPENEWVPYRHSPVVIESVVNLRWHRNTTGDYSAHAPGGVPLRVWLENGHWHASISERKIGSFPKKREAQAAVEHGFHPDSALRFSEAH